MSSYNLEADSSLRLQLRTQPPSPPRVAIATQQTANFTAGIRYANVVKTNKKTDMLVLSEEFQKMLASRGGGEQLLCIGFAGARRVGKSFLLDNILSLEAGRVIRSLSRNQDEAINAVKSASEQSQHVLYLDNNGVSSADTFLLLYMLCSVIVYSMNPDSEPEQRHLLELLGRLRVNLEGEMQQFDRPQLVIIRRDVDPRKKYGGSELASQVDGLGLFEEGVTVLSMPYPGQQDVIAKELLDVPPSQLTPLFRQEVMKLHRLLCSKKPRPLLKVHFNPHTLPIVVQSLLPAINKKQPISARNVWSEISWAFSNCYYNQYLVNYSAELARQLGSEQPHEKYALHRKLTQVRDTVDRKTGPKYRDLQAEPEFTACRSRLKEAIRNKEDLIIKVNDAKCREHHQRNFQALVSRIGTSDLSTLVDTYNKSELDCQKAQVLIQNLQAILPNLGANRQVAQNQEQDRQLEIQLEQIDKMIVQRSKQAGAAQTSQAQKYRQVLKSKRYELQSLKNELAGLKKLQAMGSDKVQSSNLEQLQRQKDRLKFHIEENEKDIEELKRINEGKVAQTSIKLKQELEEQQQLLETIRKAHQIKIVSKVAQQAQATKKTCCQIF